MKKSKGIAKTVLVAMMFLGVFATPSFAQSPPPELQAALFTKLLAYYTNLGDAPFIIHVVGAPEVAAALRKSKGAAVGKATLQDVSEGDGPPTNGAKVIYVGKSAKAVTAYSYANHVLTITGDEKLVSEGVTLGVKIEAGKPKILLNLSATKAEDINWNPAILKVASTID